MVVGLAVVQLVGMTVIMALPWFVVDASLGDPQAGYLVSDFRRSVCWLCGFAAAPWLLAAVLARPRVRLILLGAIATSPAWASLIALDRSS